MDRFRGRLRRERDSLPRQTGRPRSLRRGGALRFPSPRPALGRAGLARGAAWLDFPPPLRTRCLESGEVVLVLAFIWAEAQLPGPRRRGARAQGRRPRWAGEPREGRCVGAREVRARCCACPPASWQDALTLPILAVLQHAVTWLLPLRKTSS